jgi:hypothetical protein
MNSLLIALVAVLLVSPMAHAKKAETFGVKDKDVIAAIDCAAIAPATDCECVKREAVAALGKDNLVNIMPDNMPKEDRKIMEQNLFNLKRSISVDAGIEACSPLEAVAVEESASPISDDAETGS